MIKIFGDELVENNAYVLNKLWKWMVLEVLPLLHFGKQFVALLAILDSKELLLLDVFLPVNDRTTAVNFISVQELAETVGSYWSFHERLTCSHSSVE